MDKINISSENDILNALEKEQYLEFSLGDYGLSPAGVKTKILEFSEFFNSVGRLSLCHSNKSENEEFVCLLLNLKKNIKDALHELARSHNKKKYEYICYECKEVISIDAKQNLWTCLQDHGHVEDLFAKFLSGNLDIITENMTNVMIDPESVYSNPVPGTSNFEFANENTDSGIDNEICDTDHNGVSNFAETHEHNEGDVNNFKFNFELKYDDVIENKIYPDRIIKAVRKIDKIREYTIQKSGPFRAVCLLCSCDLVTKTKISKFAIEDHSIGQRHLRNANNSENVNNLKKYHEFWLNLDIFYQAHQVYFKPNSAALKCVLCNSVVKYEDVLSHMQRDPHKKKVLDLFEKRSTTYYLIELHVQAYGITTMQNETKEKDTKKEKAAVKPKVRTEKTDSDSSPSSGNYFNFNPV